MSLKETGESIRWTVKWGAIIGIIGLAAALSSDKLSLRDLLPDESPSGHEGTPAPSPSPGTVQTIGEAACSGSHDVIIHPNQYVVTVIPKETHLSPGVTPYEAIHSKGGWVDLNHGADPGKVRAGGTYPFPDQC